MPKDIERNQVQKLMTEGAQLIEVLPADEYEELHLPGAINIPLKALDTSAVAELDPNKPVITYCHDYQ